MAKEFAKSESLIDVIASKSVILIPSMWHPVDEKRGIMILAGALGFTDHYHTRDFDTDTWTSLENLSNIDITNRKGSMTIGNWSDHLDTPMEICVRPEHILSVEEHDSKVDKLCQLISEGKAVIIG